MVTVKFRDTHAVRLKIAKSGLSLRDFAEKIGISQSYLSQLLKGAHNPSPRVAYKIAEGLNIELEKIFLIANIDISINGGGDVQNVKRSN